MTRIRKKTLDKATEQAISQAAAAGITLSYDRHEAMVPLCGFGQMGLCCTACSQGPCRINPFDPSDGTACGRNREGIAAAGFLRLMADGAAAQASFAGAEMVVAAPLFEALAAVSEGGLSASNLLQRAIEVARAGFSALSEAKRSESGSRWVKAGAGTLDPDRINILLLGGIPADRVNEITARLRTDGGLNVVGACGAEAGGLDVAGNYGSQEALLVTDAVDGVVVGNGCVSPGFLALAERLGIGVERMNGFDAARLRERADAHYRLKAGRSLARRFPPAAAVTGFSAAVFAGLTPVQWESLAASGAKGVALVGGCNNVKETQDGAIVRMAAELLRNDFLVVASGCASAGLANAGYLDPARRTSLAGKRLQAFLADLSAASGLEVPAVLDGGSCWEMPRAVELARLFHHRLKLPLVAALPELSRPAGWASALAVASQGVPTYVGPTVPLDGALEGMSALNSLLKAKGGTMLGPAQVRQPEDFLRVVLGAES